MWYRRQRQRCPYFWVVKVAGRVLLDVGQWCPATTPAPVLPARLTTATLCPDHCTTNCNSYPCPCSTWAGGGWRGARSGAASTLAITITAIILPALTLPGSASTIAVMVNVVAITIKNHNCHGVNDDTVGGQWGQHRTMVVVAITTSLIVGGHWQTRLSADIVAVTIVTVCHRPWYWQERYPD